MRPVRHIDQIRMRAKELARSGRYIDRYAIERQLADDGYEEVGPALQDPIVRKLLKRLCEKYWRGQV